MRNIDDEKTFYLKKKREIIVRQRDVHIQGLDLTNSYKRQMCVNILNSLHRPISNTIVRHETRTLLLESFVALSTVVDDRMVHSRQVCKQIGTKFA